MAEMKLIVACLEEEQASTGDLIFLVGIIDHNAPISLRSLLRNLVFVKTHISPRSFRCLIQKPWTRSPAR
jgi:hypothetical protein